MPYPKPRLPQFKLKVCRSAAGLGLFADQEIPKGRFVIEYWGEVVPDETADQVAGRYLFALGNGRTIVGGTRANTARYANHSCDPTCEARQVGNRIFLFSIRPIRRGEPITYDYGREYFEAFIGESCRCRKCQPAGWPLIA